MRWETVLSLAVLAGFTATVVFVMAGEPYWAAVAAAVTCGALALLYAPSSRL